MYVVAVSFFSFGSFPFVWFSLGWVCLGSLFCQGFVEVSFWGFFCKGGCQYSSLVPIALILMKYPFKKINK